MDLEHILAVLGVACYAASSLLAVLALLGDKPKGERAVLALMAVGAAALAAVLVFRGMQAAAIPVFSRFDALTCYALALSGAYLLLTLCGAMRGIAGVLIPFATVVLLGGVSGLAMGVGAPAPVQGPWLALHVVTAYAAYGVFTLAGVNAIVYLMQDSNLKHKRLGVVWERFPSLETLDHSMSRLVGIAFLLLTLSIVIGVMLVHASGGGDKWFTDPKVAATVATWILLAVFVHMRASSDRHGRGIALMAVAGLACLLFAFLGVHLVAPTLHAFLRVGGGAP